MLKGKFVTEKRPRIKLNTNKIKYYKKIKYLGVYLDEKLSFLPHIKYLKEKLKKYLEKLKELIKINGV